MKKKNDRRNITEKDTSLSVDTKCVQSIDVSRFLIGILRTSIIGFEIKSTGRIPSQATCKKLNETY